MSTFIVTVLVGVIACVRAIPPWDYNHNSYYPSLFNGSLQKYIDDITQTYMDQMHRDLDRKAEIDAMMSDIKQNIPSTVSIEADKYKVTVSLPGYEEKDIKVKVETGELRILVEHKVNGQPTLSYLETELLPAHVVSGQGNWKFEKGVLTIIIPLSTGESTTEFPVNPTPHNGPANVDLDLGSNKIINPNETPKIEVTTIGQK